ncbi:hypothetical protein HPB47_020134 [Ixodes persulcatus]|uniref:Uncharacterized protein n=1 Tax=Ixodes persulcatus TaxID=34615 RepID=A0AC60QGE3_IXOPE|nr:hypothetical protein HPB47_020134 [Ixodes persulcatus]
MPCRSIEARASHYQRLPGVVASASSSSYLGSTTSDLREIIRDVVREELRKLLPAAERPASLSVAEIVRDEVQRALQPETPVDVPAPEEPTLTYAAMARRPPQAPRQATAPPRREPPAPQYSQRREERQHVRPERPSPRKTDVWRTADRRPLCYHCGEADHVYRRCPYRQLGLRGFHPDDPRPRYVMEIMPPKFRMMMNVGFGIGYTIPLLLLPLLAYYLSSWSYLQLATGLSALMMVPFWFRRNAESVVKVMRIQQEGPDFVGIEAHHLHKRGVIPLLGAHGSLRTDPAVGVLNIDLPNGVDLVVQALGSFVYYNVVLSATKVPGNPYLNYAISSSIEIPAALLGLFVATRWSRRKSQSIFLVLAGLSVLPMPFLSIASMPWLSITSNVLLRFFILSAGFIKWIMVLEVFPTTARSFGFACCMTCSRCGAILAPFLRDLGEATDPVVVPPLVLGAFSLMGAGLTLLLPETLNKPLPDTFYEAESISK